MQRRVRGTVHGMYTLYLNENLLLSNAAKEFILKIGEYLINL